MLVTISDSVAPSSTSFNNSGHAVTYLTNFYHIVEKVILEGEAGLAVGYFILNKTKSKEDYNPPEIVIGENNNSDQKAKLAIIVNDVIKQMAKKYNRKYV